MLPCPIRCIGSRVLAYLAGLALACWRPPAGIVRAGQPYQISEASRKTLCDHPAMEVWSHAGKLYEVNSFYCLPEDAWHYELNGLSGAPGAGPHITVAIPDATPDDGPFTPQPARLAMFHFGEGQTPWLVLRRFLALVESSGDLVDDQSAPTERPKLSLSNNVWRHDGKQFDVNSFHLDLHGAWCYELYETNTQARATPTSRSASPTPRQTADPSSLSQPIASPSPPTAHGPLPGRFSAASLTPSRHRATSSASNRARRQGPAYHTSPNRTAGPWNGRDDRRRGPDGRLPRRCAACQRSTWSWQAACGCWHTRSRYNPVPRATGRPLQSPTSHR